MQPAAAPEVELTFVFTACAGGDPALVSRYERQLTADERARRDRFIFPRDRLRFTLTRVALREVLARHAPAAAERWQFGTNAWGKPQLVDPRWRTALSFNVSHTEGLVMIGVTRHRALGVDVERTSRDAPLDLAERFFAPLEVQALRAQPPALQRRRFFELWTLKESYLKARGLGLSIALDRFGFELDRDPRRVVLRADADLDDAPARWQLWQLDLGPDHLAAVCVETAAGETPVLAAWRLLPGVSREAMPVAVSRSSARA